MKRDSDPPSARHTIRTAIGFILTIVGGVAIAAIAGEGRFGNFQPSLAQWVSLIAAIVILPFVIALVAIRRQSILRHLRKLSRIVKANWQLVLGLPLLLIVALGAFALIKTPWALVLTFGLVLATVLLTQYCRQAHIDEPSHREEFVDFQGDLVNWEYFGGWRTEREDGQHILIVADSEKGGIARPCRSWTDYVFEFETKIVVKYTSWIVRASDVHTYVMLQCQPDRIYPHFRVNWKWPNIEWTRGNPVPLAVHLPLNTWFGVRVEVRDVQVMITLTVDGRKLEIANIPNPLLEPPIAPIRYQRGSVGFRQAKNEHAHFRNVQVRRI